MLLRKETRKYQEDLARYCRTGEIGELKEVRTDRLHHYRRLIFNVFENTLSQAYPITRQILNEDQWLDLVQAFLENHDAKTNKIWLLAQEFYHFVKETEYYQKFNMPFLPDLLLFEWVEIEIFTMRDLSYDIDAEIGDLLDDIPVLSPEHQIIQLHYPVHLYPAHQVSDKYGEYFVLIFRHPVTKEVKFIDISSYYALLLTKLYTEQKKTRTIIEELNELLQIGDLNLLIQNSLPFLNDLMTQGFIVGFKKEY